MTSDRVIYRCEWSHTWLKLHQSGKWEICILTILIKQLYWVIDTGTHHSKAANYHPLVCPQLWLLCADSLIKPCGRWEKPVQCVTWQQLHFKKPDARGVWFPPCLISPCRRVGMEGIRVHLFQAWYAAEELPDTG